MRKKCDCGQELLPEWKFCPICGRDVQLDSFKTKFSRAEQYCLLGQVLSDRVNLTEDELDDDEAFKYFLLASKMGNSEAQLNLADFYYYGRGTEKIMRKH